MNLEEIRKSIDKIDKKLVPLFLERMACSEKVAEYKKQIGMDVLDKEREDLIVERLTRGLSDTDAQSVEAFYRSVFEISRSVQTRSLSEKKPMPRYGLCGRSLKHSYSAEIHAFLGNDNYELINLEKDEFYSYIRSRQFDALNVTIPYKKDAYALCDVIDDSAKNVGSVNTLVNKNGTLYGYNTDINGFIYMTDKAGISLSGKNVVILGTGGTSLTALEVCRIKNAGKVTVVSREGEINYGNIACLSDTEVLINTTPIGMYPDNGNSPVDIEIFPHLCGVIDVVYNPYETKLVGDARAKGIAATGGLPMLVKQAVCAHEYFFDTKCKEGVTEQILSKVMLRNMNIVLVGMPGSGKTSVGKEIANYLGKEFVDTDAEIEKNGMSITDMFEKYGEDYFRSVESHEIAKAAKKSGLVIATGGGAVKRECNRRALRGNAIVVYVKRELEKLSDKGRPLSKGGIDRIKQLYNERHEIYENVSDISIDTREDINACAIRLVNTLQNLDYYSFRKV